MKDELFHFHLLQEKIHVGFRPEGERMVRIEYSVMHCDKT